MIAGGGVGIGLGIGSDLAAADLRGCLVAGLFNSHAGFCGKRNNLAVVGSAGLDLNCIYAVLDGDSASLGKTDDTARDGTGLGIFGVLQL